MSMPDTLNLTPPPASAMSAASDRPLHAPQPAIPDPAPELALRGASPDASPLASPPSADPWLTIEPSIGWAPLDAPELWRFRELFWIFAARDIKVRYKQTVLGSAWALIQPLIFTVLGTIVFGRLAGAGTDNVQPAFLFYLVSQLPWMLFNTGLQTSAMSLVGAQNMIKKVYFPRLVLPASAVVVSLVDFLVQLGLVAAVLLILPFIPRVPAFLPPIQILLLPIAAAWSFLAALALGLPLAALNVEYRDVRYIIPFVTQFMIFAAPVFWSIERISAAWRPLYALVPIAAPIDFFRWCILGTPPHPLFWLIGAAATAATLLAGLAYFRRVEDTFADVV
jgi:lipopolysaccharide transport system permease protein